MLARILTVFFGAPLLLLLAWLGGVYLALAVAGLIILMQKEFVGLISELNPHRTLVFAGGLILVAGAFYDPVQFPGVIPVVLLFLFLMPVVLLFPRFSPASSAGTLLAVLYPGLLVYVYLLRVLPEGWQWLLLVLLVTWAFDTFGYFTGKMLGRTRMTPNLSPKKTFEGLAGGLLAAAGVAVGGGQVLTGLSMGPLLLLGLLLGTAAQVGDLLASAFKRFTGVKDAGSLLPGHGGVFDRFDSLLLTAPIAYYYIYLVGLHRG